LVWINILEPYTLITSIFLAFGLSAACGFRIFIPPLTYGLLYKADLVQLGDGWYWIGNDWVIAVFALAALIEITGNLVPWLDNLLDVIATPTAIIAGTTLSAACLSEIDPGLKWMLSVMSGVLVTGGFQLTTVGLRGLSSIFTGGLINPIISFIEDLISLVISIAVILFPILGILLVILIALFLRRIYIRLKKRKRRSSPNNKVKDSFQDELNALKAEIDELKNDKK
tara:strand:+ start:18 stop:698 length:681 start_codon:yes stop_codon:yes gene_type:complete